MEVHARTAAGGAQYGTTSRNVFRRPPGVHALLFFLLPPCADRWIESSRALSSRESACHLPSRLSALYNMRKWAYDAVYWAARDCADEVTLHHGPLLSVLGHILPLHHTGMHTHKLADSPIPSCVVVVARRRRRAGAKPGPAFGSARLC